MGKRLVKKTKIKLFNLILILVFLVGLFFGVSYFIKIPTRKGTSYISDDYILEAGSLKEYPPFVLLNRAETCKKINKTPYISSCKIKKKWGFLLEVNVVENRPFFYDTNQNQYVLDHGEVVEENDVSRLFRVPRLLNYVPDTKYEKFLSGMGKIKEDILSKVSDMEYLPNEYDKDRFLFYMDDGNMVYLTLTKFKLMNHYNEVLPQLEGHKGILYLDSGNHFQIKE